MKKNLMSILSLFRKSFILLIGCCVVYGFAMYELDSVIYSEPLVFKQGKSQIEYENNFKKNVYRARNKRNRASGFLKDQDRMFYKRAMAPDKQRVTSKRRTRDGFKKKHTVKE